MYKVMPNEHRTYFENHINDTLDPSFAWLFDNTFPTTYNLSDNDMVYMLSVIIQVLKELPNNIQRPTVGICANLSHQVYHTINEQLPDCNLTEDFVCSLVYDMIGVLSFLFFTAYERHLLYISYTHKSERIDKCVSYPIPDYKFMSCWENSNKEYRILFMHWLLRHLSILNDFYIKKSNTSQTH